MHGSLEPIDLDGTAITADALHAQHHHARYLRDRGAHRIAVVRPNDPTLYDRIRRLPWKEISVDQSKRTRARHRCAIRRPKTAAFRHIASPGARQALQVVGWRRDHSAGTLTIEQVSLVISKLPQPRDRPPPPERPPWPRLSTTPGGSAPSWRAFSCVRPRSTSRFT